MSFKSRGSSGNDQRWNNNFISTPTFDLSPVEKPDMSPFLIHMTGKEEILSILKGRKTNDLDDHGESEYGFLESCIPRKAKRDYKAKVVCFTESPTFALDFFRRRKISRKDQCFGLGFSKASLVEAGVRPVLYLDEPMTNKINDLFRNLKDQERENSTDPASKELAALVRSLYPLAFPLLEGNNFQGFMWEREWRMTSEDGFLFKHSDLRIICCPKEEQAAIEAVLKEHKNHVKFVRSWQQYNDVTDFLTRQEKAWEEKNHSIQSDKQLGESSSDRLQELLSEYQSTLETLNKRKEYIESLQREKDVIEGKILKIQKSLIDCQRQIEEEKLQQQNRSKLMTRTLQNAQDIDYDDIPF